MTRTIAIIAAVAANGAIGFRGGIPWDSPEDRRIFADKTAGGVLLCGVHTVEKMHPAIGRRLDNSTLVRIFGGECHAKFGDDGDFKCSWTWVCKYSIEAVANHYPDRNIWICGGSRLYAEAMRHPLVTEMHLTMLDYEPEADTFFPLLRWGGGAISGVEHQTNCGVTHLRFGFGDKMWIRKRSVTLRDGVHMEFHAYAPNHAGDLCPL